MARTTSPIPGVVGLNAEEAEVVMESSGAQLARWMYFIQTMAFKVPRDTGMLWSKLGGTDRAVALARAKHLTCLEMELGKMGFFDLYEKDFGEIGTPGELKNQTTARIWKAVSELYVRSLEGKVTGYVHRAAHFKHIEESAVKTARATGVDPKNSVILHQVKKQGNPHDPVLVAEEKEISDLLLTNSKITELELIDVESGETFGYRTREIQEWFRRAESR